MRLNKKIFNIGIAVILSCTVLSVSAASAVNVSIDHQNAISVSGSIETTDGKAANIMLRLTNPDGELVYVDACEALPDDDGDMSFDFGTALLSLNLPSDTYNVSITGRNLSAPYTDTIDIHGADRKYKVIHAVSVAENASAVKAALTGTTDGKDNYDILKLDMERYNSLGEATSIVDSYLAPMEYDLAVNPDDGLSEDEILKIQAAVEAFHGDYTDALASALFAKAGTAAEVKAWIDTYYDHYGFNEDAALTAIVNEVLSEKDFVRRISEAQEALTIDEIKTYIYESALLTYVYVKTDSEVLQLVSDFPAYFTVGEDYTDNLASYEQAAVIGDVAGKVYKTCADATKAIDDRAELVIDARDDDSGSGNSRGNGSNRNNTVSVPVLPAETDVVDPALPQEKTLTDLHAAKWAEEAVLYLYNKGIVSGNPDGAFLPNNKISRAEFVKLAVEALGLETASAENIFVDVPADSWYASYVSKAYAEGLVTGDELKRFRPDAEITRQDMVTILYRALDVQKETADEPAFTDKEMIADYAYPAVRYFSGNGIVNGLEDGSFAATRGATRAEAAMVFYKLLTILL